MLVPIPPRNPLWRVQHKARLAPSRLHLDHRLSDWPECWLELRRSCSPHVILHSVKCCCSGATARSGACWRLLGWMVAAVVLSGWLASTLVLWWDTGAIAAARVEKPQLQMEVAELWANRDK